MLAGADRSLHRAATSTHSEESGPQPNRQGMQRQVGAEAAALNRARYQPRQLTMTTGSMKARTPDSSGLSSTKARPNDTAAAISRICGRAGR